MLKRFGNALFSAIPLRVYQKIIRRKVIGVNYHVVSDDQLDHIRHLYPYKTVDLFEKDLVYLKKNHHLISYEQLLSNTEIKPNSVIVTFDDGYKEFYSVIRPLLLKHDIPAIFFTTTNLIDNKHLFMRNGVSLCINKLERLEKDKLNEIVQMIKGQYNIRLTGKDEVISWVRTLSSKDETIMKLLYERLKIDCTKFLREIQPYLTTEQIQQLVADGFTIGGHTLDHPNFLDLKNENEIEHQIVESCKWIRSITNADYVPFAFPFTSEGLDREFIKNVIEKNNFIRFMFGESRLTKPESFFIYRLKGDSILGSDGVKSNLFHLFKLEYISYIKSLIRNLFSR